MVKTVVHDPAAYDRARAAMDKEAEDASLARRLLRKAADRTLTIDVLGEAVVVHWPGQDLVERAMTCMSAFQTTTRAVRDDGDAAPETLRAAAEALKQDLARLAEELTVDASLTASVFEESEHGVELATRIVFGALREVQLQAGVVKSFRGEQGRAGVRAAPAPSRKGAKRVPRSAGA